MAQRTEPRNTRRVIMRGARKVLSEHGLAGVTTRRIGEAAGVNQALIHYHFGSVDELLNQVMIDHAERQLPALEAILDGPGTFIEKISTLMRNVGDPKSDARFPKLMLEITTLAISDSERLDSYRTRLAQPGTDLMREAILKELKTTGAEAQRTAAQVACLIQTINRGATIDRVVGLDPGHDDMIDAILGLIERLISQEPSS